MQPTSSNLFDPITVRAMLLMIASMAFFSLMNIFIRYASFELHTTQIVFLRNFFSVLIMLPWVVHVGIGPALKTKRLAGHFWRGTIGVIGMQLWFYSVATLPLNEATALSFTAPIFTAIFAITILGEKAGWHRWSAILIGFAGAMVIIRPDPGNMNWDMLIVPCATSVWAVAGLLVKTLTTTEHPNRIVFYMALFMTLWAAPAAWWYWQEPSWEMIGLCFAVALSSTGAHICMVRAYSGADMVMLMPFDFFRLIFTAIFAYIAFHEVSDHWTWLGGGIIVTSAAYISYREAKKKRAV